MKLFQNPYVVGALALVAALLVFRNTIQPMLKRSAPAKRSPAAQAAPHAPAVSAGKNTQPITPPRTTDAAGTTRLEPQAGIDLARVGWSFNGSPPRDPFQLSGSMSPPARLVPPAGEVLALTAVWRQTGGSLAVINGRILGAGEVIEGFTVESIESEVVWVHGIAGREPLEFKRPNTTPTNASPRTAALATQQTTAAR